jgi:hypothetical protein
MSPLTLAETCNFSKELTASIFREEKNEFCRFHGNIGRFLPHFTTSSPIKHYVTFNTYSPSVGRAIALVVRPWLPRRVFGSASVIRVKFEAGHSSLVHVSPCQSLLLGTVINDTNDETEEIRATILAANKAYSSLQTIFRSKQIQRTTR